MSIRGSETLKNKFYCKILAVGIIVLFIGIAIASPINANIESISNKKLISIKCQFFTKSGVQEVNKEVNSKDLDYLFNLIDSSDYNAIASKLYSLDLLPESINTEDAKNLLNGEYGKQEFKKYQTKLKEPPIVDNGFEIIRNVFCTVNGEARDSYIYPLWGLVGMAISFPLIILDGICFDLFPNYPGVLTFFYDEVGFFGAIALLLIIAPYISRYFTPSFRSNACLKLLLEDGPKSVMPYVNTSGFFGDKSMEGWILDTFMVGFIGILITYKDDYVNEPGCKFMGFSLYTRVKKYPFP